MRGEGGNTRWKNGVRGALFWLRHHENIHTCLKICNKAVHLSFWPIPSDWCQDIIFGYGMWWKEINPAGFVEVGCTGEDGSRQGDHQCWSPRQPIKHRSSASRFSWMSITAHSSRDRPPSLDCLPSCELHFRLGLSPPCRLFHFRGCFILQGQIEGEFLLSLYYWQKEWLLEITIKILRWSYIPGRKPLPKLFSKVSRWRSLSSVLATKSTIITRTNRTASNTSILLMNRRNVLPSWNSPSNTEESHRE